MTDQSHWAVCRTFSSRVHWVRPEIEKTNHGTFLPTYARVWASDGKLSCRERALMPGYLFFMTDPDGWGDVANVEGVHAVLANNGRASRVTDEEMRRLVLGHILRDYDEINLDGLERAPREQKRRRRTRTKPSKRARAAA
ncbi:transcription termination/antitermination NusG family protein [Bradyrhizobium sp. Leo121]|uniref:transcription termination/antitermination protein NusG n=1 Tax=Bradyrhizobium sp. Leo121 TaxID=1571195 RepID=UPI001028893F|nr:transcription termination/antitermination NusG family protein [Bradyrhizobium sp. Leo121]RZN19477.1 antitermination protein NusG [Bradyrhizobium sp. Leo121]